MSNAPTIIASHFNQDITKSLIAGAHQCLTAQGYKDLSQPIRVPGAYELPIASKWVIENQNPVAIVLLGCVIEGETRHFDVICDSLAISIQKLMLKTGVAILMGVLMTKSREQALARSNPNNDENHGYQVMKSALSMVKLHNSIDQ
jgi:6,7-dimethyl-8-ribityllumazine synthase